MRGGQATELLDKIKKNRNNDMLLAPLFERAGNSESTSYEKEITATSGSYNFPWRLRGQHGLGTAFFNSDPKSLRLHSIRNASGDDVVLDGSERKQILQQAHEFIGHE